jgi:predicted acylesterase/phospholipase RssA/CRP-like cAMP-binding protein
MQADVQGQIPVFAGLSAAALDDVRRRMRPRQFAAGAALCRVGEPGESLFVIERGLALVTLDAPGGKSTSASTVERLRRGDVVGEMALLTGEPRSATVVAAVPTTALELDREGFASVVARHPGVLMNLSRIVSRRLHRATAARRRPSRGEAVALVVDGRGASLAGTILAATAAASPAAVAAIDLTGEMTEGPLVRGVDDRSVVGAVALLDDLLPRHGTVVIVAGIGQDHLPALLEQADRDIAVVALGGAERLAALGRGVVDGVEVVLVTDGPAGEVGSVAGTRVIRTCAPDGPAGDVAWIGRHLARTKLGLALGAGGAKGYAHVATIQVLEDAGYTVDYVAGSSIGAMVGAWLALGQNGAAIEATMRGAFSPEMVAAMFKLSLSGLSSGQDQMVRVCRETTEDRSFADLGIPLVAMTVDLDAREPCPITEGAVWEALVAATSLPGMFPPHQRDGRRLVDGLCLVPVPTDAVRAAGADIVVSVNLMSRDTLPAWPGEPVPTPGPARAGVRMLDALLETLDLAQLDASVRHAARADVVVTPRFGPSTWREFDRAERFLAAGRAAAEEQLAVIRGLARPQAEP